MSVNSGTQISVVAKAIGAVRGAMAGVAGISGVTNLLMLTGPLFMMQIYDRVLASGSLPTLVALSALVIGLYLFLGILELIRSRVLVSIGSRLEEELGDKAFSAVLTLPLKLGKCDAASQPVRDLDQLRQFMSGQGPVAICDLPWMPLYLVIIFAFHPWLGWLATVGGLLLIVLTISSEAALREPMKRLAGLSAQRAEAIDAGKRNSEALRAMGMRENYAARWRKTNQDYLEGQASTANTAGGFSATTKILRLALQSAVLAVGAWLAILQEVSPGVMIAASILTSRALSPIEQAIGHWKGFLAARQSRKRLSDLLNKLHVEEPQMALPAPRQSMDVQGLAVTSPGSTSIIVRDLSFRLEAGQGLGVIGPSGSGKSTLARALVGIWPAIRGTVRLDGAELDQWAPEALGPSVGYLPQGVELFDGTVAENISRFTPDASSEAIIAAAQQAGVHQLILGLPDGYGTQIGSGGRVLSAGQRQRIGLARALFGNPFLIVLDEPNANLDAEGDAALTTAIASARQAGSIVIVIAHRPSALAALGHVLVLADGVQKAFGPRDEVLKKTTVRPVAEIAS